jgi:hypothetical protein
MLQFPLYTLMVYDHQNNGIPVAFFLTGEGTATSISKFLKSFMEACRKKKADFDLNCMITDNDDAELLAIRHASIKCCVGEAGCSMNTDCHHR